ncbi:MAG: C39 family peptidase [Anaerolineales bacterium]|nr:C39 family peptidase [Anaerolineales bacterium]
MLTFFPQETRVSCTVACLRMVLFHWGIESDESMLRLCCKTTQQGTRASEVVACARQYNLSAEELRDVPWQKLQAWLSEGIYPIALLNLYPLHALWVNHAVVLENIHEDMVDYLDPIFGRKSSPRAPFEQAWEMNRKRAILIWR